MKKISVLLIISFLASIALGKGEPIPPYKLEGAPAKQVKYYPAGRNQWDKIPECESLGEHYEICPICRGSGELIYFVKGRRVGTYDCFKCGPGSKSNSPDGLITAKGEDITKYYFPEMVVEDTEIEMTEDKNMIKGDIDLVTDEGKRISRGILEIVLGFQYGRGRAYINALNFNWIYRGNSVRDQTFISNRTCGRKFIIIDDDQITLELHILKYSGDTLTVKLFQKQNELFAANKKVQEPVKDEGSEKDDD